ncbi:hypothetical protein WJX72_008321 [[Myrmecia] bisecta]|uniref:Cyanobacterial aminoacyl-tRNA synthetase CAAD domain-containing protein n=1 Tax=[Myrmecia] bisecta TaxID=41462 RepID=A0AAW1PPH4_9CHLO
MYHAVTEPFLVAKVRRSFAVAKRSQLIVRATGRTPTPVEEETAVDVEGLVKDLQEKWDGVENKTSVAIYAGGAFVLLWFSSTIVGAVNSVPLLPKILELVGLGYSAWFVYRYLLFKSSREELIADVEELKKKISGAVEESS